MNIPLICLAKGSFFLGISYNRPKFCANASWNASAITFVKDTTVGGDPTAVFVSNQNTVYVVVPSRSLILAWREGDTVETRNISGNLSGTSSFFVSDDGDIYVDKGNANRRVEKWSVSSTNVIAAMYTCKQCSGLFIDIRNNLHCSVEGDHQVITKSLDNHLNIWKVVAGDKAAGSTPTQLNYPHGIFVDGDFNLYVADYSNNRIQKFPFGQITGTTIAGTGAPGTIPLNNPSAVVLDADGYLFISDRSNDRIVSSGPYGFQCIMGCSGAGSSASQLFNPDSISFDSYGNLYVTDSRNNRIQKFLLISNGCGK